MASCPNSFEGRPIPTPTPSVGMHTITVRAKDMFLRGDSRVSPIKADEHLLWVLRYVRTENGTGPIPSKVPLFRPTVRSEKRRGEETETFTISSKRYRMQDPKTINNAVPSPSSNWLNLFVATFLILAVLQVPPSKLGRQRRRLSSIKKRRAKSGTIGGGN